MHALPAALFCCASGLALVCAGWPRQVPLASDLRLNLSLAPCCGFGLFSIIFFLCLTFSLSGLIPADAAVLGLLLAILLGIQRLLTSAVIAQARRGRTAGML